MAADASASYKNSSTLQGWEGKEFDYDLGLFKFDVEITEHIKIGCPYR